MRHPPRNSWDTPVRIRHVVSGRYLAVDTEDVMKELAVQNEMLFSTFLVDDAAVEDDEDGLWNLASQEQMTFYISSADAVDDDKVPLSVSARSDSLSTPRPRRPPVCYPLLCCAVCAL